MLAAMSRLQLAVVIAVAIAGASLAVAASLGIVVTIARLIGMPTRDVVPLAGVMTALVSAAATVAVTAWNSQSARRHDLELARDNRLFEHRAAAYVEVVEVLTSSIVRVERVLPEAGTHESPFMIDPDERQRLTEQNQRADALVAAFGSPTLRRLLGELGKVESRFLANAARAEVGFRVGDPRAVIKPSTYEIAAEIRDEYRALMRKIRDQVGHELGALPSDQDDA